MRALRQFTEPEKVRVKFTHVDLTNCLFYNTSPTFTFHPFKYLSPVALKSLSLTAKVSLSDPPKAPRQLLDESLLQVNSNKIMNVSTWRQISPWMLSAVLLEIKKGLKDWKNYLIVEMEDYCKTFDSSIQWSYVKHGGVNTLFPSPTPEQKYWLTVNDYLDKQDVYKYVEAVKESVLPWMNLQLWKDIKKKEENTRVNVDYERVRREFLERSVMEDEELDIIK